MNRSASLALFDFDGTITTRDTFTPFLRFAIPATRAVVGGLLISPLLFAYRLRLVAAATTRPIVVRAGFQGRSAEPVYDLGRRYAAEALPNVLAGHAMERVRWHRERGDTVVVVSAGLDVYLKPWFDSHGLGARALAILSLEGNRCC